jgi:hypothetical protein
VALDVAGEPSHRLVTRRGRIRRCRVRKVSILPGDGALRVQVDCLLLGPDGAITLGSMDDARAICNACEAPSVWRADEE